MGFSKSYKAQLAYMQKLNACDSNYTLLCSNMLCPKYYGNPLDQICVYSTLLGTNCFQLYQLILITNDLDTRVLQFFRKLFRFRDFILSWCEKNTRPRKHHLSYVWLILSYGFRSRQGEIVVRDIEHYNYFIVYLFYASKSGYILQQASYNRFLSTPTMIIPIK